MPEYVYWPERRLGDGGGGLVYEGEARYQRGAAVPIAVKLMFASQWRDPQRVNAFFGEAHVGYLCGHHEHLVLTRGYGRTPSGRPYLVIDREGASADRLLWSLHADMSAVRAVTLGTLRGLMHLHECGLEHGDVHKGNLFVGYDGVVRVGDFGSVWPHERATVRSNPRWAAKNPALAARAARAHEQGLDDRCAFARVLYELVTGQSLFKDERMTHLDGDAPADLRDVIRGLSAPSSDRMSLQRAAARVTESGEPIADLSAMRSLLQACLEGEPAVEYDLVESEAGERRLVEVHLSREPLAAHGLSREPLAAHGLSREPQAAQPARGLSREPQAAQPTRELSREPQVAQPTRSARRLGLGAALAAATLVAMWLLAGTLGPQLAPHQGTQQRATPSQSGLEQQIIPEPDGPQFNVARTAEPSHVTAERRPADAAQPAPRRVSPTNATRRPRVRSHQRNLRGPQWQPLLPTKLFRTNAKPNAKTAARPGRAAPLSGIRPRSQITR